MRPRAVPDPLLDPNRLAALRALGLPTTFVRRSALSEAERAALLPRLPGERPGDWRQPQARPAIPVAPRAAAAAPPPTAQEQIDEQAPGAEPAQRTASPRAAAPIGASAAVARPPAAPARLRQIATLDQEALATLAQGCRACKLGSLRHQAVFGVGHAQAQVMVVGEAPGAEEDRLGEPFVGAAGKLLDNMLRAAGLARAGDDPARTVYIANVIKCRPPGNRNPEADEIAQCEPILERQIALVRPRLLLALGRFAAQQLTGSTEPIGRLRQRLFRHQGIPVVVSYHPAYLLRTPLDKAKAWADLCFAQEQLAAVLQTGDSAASDSAAS